MTTAKQALDLLREGNRRFVAGEGDIGARVDESRRRQLLQGQQPSAVIVGCSDSRVPPEILFDQGLGDLFVIRVAGNVVAASQLGSVEYAVGYLGTRLVVVLGHSTCGAVLATLDELERPSVGVSSSVRSVLDSIRPSVAPLMETGLRHDREALVREAVRANVRSSIDRLREGSAVLRQLMSTEDLRILGAEYSLASGAVDFFEDLE